jgi:hypothetical protein
MHKPGSPEGHNFCEGEFLFQELTGGNPQTFLPLTFQSSLSLKLIEQSHHDKLVLKYNLIYSASSEEDNQGLLKTERSKHEVRMRALRNICKKYIIFLFAQVVLK